MSLSLYVRCNCLRDGQYKPLPQAIVPFVKIKGNMYYWKFPGITNDEAPTIAMEEKYHNEYKIYVEWIRIACSHGNSFRAEDFEIGQWTLLHFMDALDKIDYFKYEMLYRLYQMSDTGEYGELTMKESVELLSEINYIIDNLKSIKIKDWDYLTDILTQLFSASVQTGNPLNIG